MIWDMITLWFDRTLSNETTSDGTETTGGKVTTPEKTASISEFLERRYTEGVSS
jgi:hypothetical protein